MAKKPYYDNAVVPLLLPRRQLGKMYRKSFRKVGPTLCDIDSFYIDHEKKWRFLYSAGGNIDRRIRPQNMLFID
jgi:hypothetical protein